MIMRKLFPSPAAADVTIEIDRWQLTGILGAVLVACALSFFVGVVVGKKAASPAVAADVFVPTKDHKLGKVSARERHLAMAEVSPGTSFIDEGLAEPIADPAPDDPTDAARIETHRQLQDFRAAGRRGELPVGPSQPQAAMAPLIVDQPTSVTHGGYTLQVAMLESKSAAQAIASELESSGHPVRVREMSAQGRQVFRVELGDFKSAEGATAFKGRFERESGYSPMLVTLP